MNKTLLLCFLTIGLLVPEIGHCAQLNTVTLSHIIAEQFKNDCANIDVTDYALYIAAKCSDATDSVELTSSLDNTFQHDPKLAALNLNYSKNQKELTNVEADIAKEQFPTIPDVISLKNIIKNELLACPDADITNAAQSSFYIADACISSSASNSNAIQSELIKLFSEDPCKSLLNYKQNKKALKQAATRIVSDIYQPYLTTTNRQVSGDLAQSNSPKTDSTGEAVQTNSPSSGSPKDLQQSIQATNSNWRAGFSSGAEFLNPYVVSVPNGATYGTLTNSGNSTVGYLEFDLTRRWVFNPYDASPNNNWVNRFPVLAGINPKNWGDMGWDDFTPDFQYNVGFLFGNSASSTNKTYSAQTLAGSDIFTQLGAGLPLWRNDYKKDNGIPVQLALAGSIGMTTQQTFEKVHANEFIGGALDVGLNYGLFGLANTNAPGVAEFKFGESHLDFPSMTGINDQVNLDGNGVPIFNEKWVPEMDANLLIPFGSYLYLNVEATAFLRDQTPDQWNVRVGVTVPWSTVQGMFPFIK